MNVTTIAATIAHGFRSGGPYLPCGAVGDRAGLARLPALRPANAPQPGLRLALAYLYDIAGDDPGVGPRSREPFDELWRLVMNTAGDVMGTGDCARASYADTQYARIRRMVRYPQTLANDEGLRQFNANG